MKKHVKIPIILIMILITQFLVYHIFILPYTSQWGATDKEASMTLAGDSLFSSISSTRTISIKASQAETWKWVTQLGADRAGFFSYEFLEKAMGYETEAGSRYQITDESFEVGRVIPGSIDETKSLIAYNFPVIYVDPGKSFVVEKWGTFFLDEVDSATTRLIIRTNGVETPTFTIKILDYIVMAGHYIMERRMMTGLKAAIENRPIPPVYDVLWFVGIILSALLILIIIINGRDAKTLPLLLVYSILWQLVVFVFPPKPQYSLLLFFLLLVQVRMTFLTGHKHSAPVHKEAT